MGSREWGMGSGEWDNTITSNYPIPHSPLGAIKKFDSETLNSYTAIAFNALLLF